MFWYVVITINFTDKKVDKDMVIENAKNVKEVNVVESSIVGNLYEQVQNIVIERAEIFVRVMVISINEQDI